MLKRAGVLIVTVILFTIMFTFTALNTGQVELNLGFLERSFPISIAFAGTFVVGILFGMSCMVAFVFRSINERRGLRRLLRASESEVSNLRNLPLSDAD